MLLLMLVPLPGFEGDTTYLAAAFTSTNIREYDLAYVDVTIGNRTVEPSVSRLYGYLRSSNNWLYCKCVCVCL